MAKAYVIDAPAYEEMTEDGLAVVVPYAVVVEFLEASAERKDPGRLLASTREFRFRDVAQEFADEVNDLIGRGGALVARDASGIHWRPYVPDLRTLRERWEEEAEIEEQERHGLR